MPNLGAPELIIVLVIVLLLFGGRKLPDLARSIGTSMKEFRKASNEALEDDGSDAPEGSPDDETSADRDRES